MPVFYDVNRAFTSSGSAGTEVTHLWGKTAANQETAGIVGVYCAARFATAGGGQINVKTNTGTTASGGTGTTPNPKNMRLPAASMTWNNDATTITAGATLVVRLTVGFAQTGGMGGWVPIVPSDAIQMMPNATNPVDIEITSNCSVASVTATTTVEFGEGI
jgi:hypothetical protein